MYTVLQTGMSLFQMLKRLTKCYSNLYMLLEKNYSQIFGSRKVFFQNLTVILLVKNFPVLLRNPNVHSGFTIC